MSVVSQKMSIPDTGRSKSGVALPMIKVAHPASRLEDPSTINIRGMSRQSSSRGSVIGEELHRHSANIMRPITADQMPFGNIKSPRHNSLPPLGEDLEMKLNEDRSKPNIPIFGSAADYNGNRTSRPSTTSTIATGRVSTEELEKMLREKMKTGYFTVKTAFKAFDPEGKGIVNRESLARILSNFLAVPIGLSQFNKLTSRLGLELKKMISFEDFYVCFRPVQNEDGKYPTWLELPRKSKETMTASQVHLQLKEKAKQRFLNMASLIPQMNPGGTKRILKPEFRNALNNLGFHMDDEEYEKLWSKFDTENIGAVNGEKILNKLGITMDGHRPASNNSNTSRRRSSPRNSPEPDEKESFDIERWMTNKFREGARELMHAFYEMDLTKKGTVNKAQLKRVLSDYNIQLDDAQVNDLLLRCELPTSGPIDYKVFIKRFQDRSEIGMANKILNDPKHKYNQDIKEVTFLDPSAAEAKLMDLFQTEFLSLLGSFHKIDRENSMTLSESQFRAVIESKFKFEISEAAFKSLMRKVPLDEHGLVKYVEFMSKFDSKEAKSLFDAKSTIAAPRDLKDFDDEIPPASPREERMTSRAASRDSYDSQEGRGVEELRPLIKSVLSRNYQAIERAFQELDEFNSRKLTPEMLIKLLKMFDLHVSKNEIKRIWDVVITDQKGHLEFMQFVRHFGYSMKSAAYPNAKLSPPKKGDSDFQLRSKKLNSAYDMLEDSLRSKVDQNWEQIHKYFHEIDPNRCGYVSKEQFANILQRLCIHLTDYECDILSKKFDILKDGSTVDGVQYCEGCPALWKDTINTVGGCNQYCEGYSVPWRISWIEFLKPFSLKRQVYRKGNNMMNLLTHPSNEQGNGFPKGNRGLPSVASKLKEKISGDTKLLQRAFKKLDTRAQGSLSVQEFVLVLKLCDINLSDEEEFQLLSDLDKNMTGRIKYGDFLDKLKSL